MSKLIYSFSNKNATKEATINQVKTHLLLISCFKKMKESLLIRIAFIFLSILLIFFPVALQADQIDSFQQEVEPSEIVEAPNQMTQKQMNDLFGEDPYLGQTSYLQSPDGFSQRDKSK